MIQRPFQERERLAGTIEARNTHPEALEPSSYTLITDVVRPRFSPKWPFRDARLEVLVLKPGFTLNRPSHTSVHEDASPQC